MFDGNTEYLRNKHHAFAEYAKKNTTQFNNIEALKKEIRELKEENANLKKEIINV